MPNVFVPWRQFFKQAEKQSIQPEWLASALFNDHGALFDEPAPRAPKKPAFRLRREAESISDLRACLYSHQKFRSTLARAEIRTCETLHPLAPVF
jgi:hypothetical protein